MRPWVIAAMTIDFALIAAGLCYFKAKGDETHKDEELAKHIVSMELDIPHKYIEITWPPSVGYATFEIHSSLRKIPRQLPKGTLYLEATDLTSGIARRKLT